MLQRHDSGSPVQRAALLLLLSSFASCASPPLAPPPPKSPLPPPTSPIAKSSEPEADAATSEVAVVPDWTTIVVEAGVEGAGLGTDDIVSIAKAERERRANTPAPSIVINNDSLSRRPGPKSKPIAGKPTPKTVLPTAPVPNREAEEAIWRERGLDIRTRIKESREKVEKLKKLTAAMRERFYLAPPQLGRDDTLWQEWGRMQETLAEAEKKSQETAKELDDYLEDGRFAGAEPGWLAEGEELLIEKKKDSPPDSPQAIEPPEIVPPGDWPE